MAGTRTLEACTAWMTPVTRTSCFASSAAVAAGVVGAWTEAAGRSQEARTKAERAVARTQIQGFIYGSRRLDAERREMVDGILGRDCEMQIGRASCRERV